LSVCLLNNELLPPTKLKLSFGPSVGLVFCIPIPPPAPKLVFTPEILDSDGLISSGFLSAKTGCFGILSKMPVVLLKRPGLTPVLIVPPVIPVGKELLPPLKRDPPVGFEKLNPDVVPVVVPKPNPPSFLTSVGLLTTAKN
jgi:hypothetical protein